MSTGRMVSKFSICLTTGSYPYEGLELSGTFLKLFAYLIGVITIRKLSREYNNRTQAPTLCLELGCHQQFFSQSSEVINIFKN
jgi:hypothetical protein